jgi:ADP-heptose:LPS heptosyltransferase
MIMMINKVLIIRFSSFGDIVQCSTVVELIRQKYPGAKVDWVTRSDFGNLVKLNGHINNVWSFNKHSGLKGLIELGKLLRNENYDRVYDAHNNLRSKLLSLFLRTRIIHRPKWLTRSKDRLKRILLFIFRINLLPKPYKGIESYRTPLKKWGITAEENGRPKVAWKFSYESQQKVIPYIKHIHPIALVPSAAWEMKRWPLAHWKKLIELMPERLFVVMGGKEDLFCQELEDIDPTRVRNLAGSLSLVESCALIEKSPLVISADTGLLHVADVLGIKAISLMGPTAFGFTSSEKIITLEVELPCRPCTKDGRGSCSQSVYQLCMVNITPQRVADEARHLLRE